MLNLTFAGGFKDVFVYPYWGGSDSIWRCQISTKSNKSQEIQEQDLLIPGKNDILVS